DPASLSQRTQTGFRRNSADWARSHSWLLTIDKRHRSEHARSVGEADGESHRLADDATGEGGGVGDSAIDRVCIDIVRPRSFEATIGIRLDRPDGVAESAADVDMDIGLVDDESGVLTTPRSGDLGDMSRGDGGAGEGGQERRDYEAPRRSEA